MKKTMTCAEVEGYDLDLMMRPEIGRALHGPASIFFK